MVTACYKLTGKGRRHDEWQAIRMPSPPLRVLSMCYGVDQGLRIPRSSDSVDEGHFDDAFGSLFDKEGFKFCET